MQVIFSTRGMTISKSYQDAIVRRLAKLEPLLPILETRAVLSREKHRRTAALTLVAKRHTFHSEETAGDLEVAVDLAVDALARQVREAKDRVKNRKARHARRAGGGGRGAGNTGDIVARRVPLKSMSVDDAAATLARGDDDFVLFINAATDDVNVLYRGTDGALELVEPVA